MHYRNVCCAPVAPAIIGVHFPSFSEAERTLSKIQGFSTNALTLASHFPEGKTTSYPNIPISKQLSKQVW